MTFSVRNKKIVDGVIRNKRLANGYIFHGASGSFIEEAGLYFSQGLAAELVEVNTEGKIGVDEIRQLRERIKYGPSLSTYMVVLIYAADTLTTEAANAFLKTLEEPPAGVHFILLTSQLFGLLPTIRSRCQALDFQVTNNNPAWTGKLPYVSYDDVKKMDDMERLELAENLAQSKEDIPSFLDRWAQESRSELLIEKINDFKYNLNFRLQLEALFLYI